MVGIARNSRTARLVAIDLARSQFSSSNRAIPDDDLLSSFVAEAEGCWVFFLAEELIPSLLPGELFFSAYAVARHSEAAADVYDFRPNLEMVQSYADLWSLHTLNRKEEATVALDAFNRKYPLLSPNPLLQRTACGVR